MSAPALLSRSRLPAPSSAAGLRRRLLGTQPPLSVEMPGIPKLEPASLKARPKTQVSVLPNGLRVISEETYGASSSVGLFVDAGSRYETDANNGVSHILEQMAFKSTTERSHQRIVRDVEEMGATVSATSAREYAVYTADVLRPNLDKAVELVAETVLKPKFAPWDIDEQRAVVEIELQDMEKNPQAMVTEMMYAAAYTDSTPLGRPLFCPLRNLHKIGPQELTAFYKEHYHVNRMILSAAGVDHNELVGLARKYFGNAAPGPAAPKLSASKYVGGDLRLRCDSPLTQVSLGFNSGGWNSPQLLPICVMHMLLGGGSAFSAGGPGKGMYSRLYMNLLNKHYWVDSATAFQSMHTDAGIIGIYATAEPRDCGKLVDVMASELLSLASKVPGEEETRRAKNQLKSSVFMNLESRQVLVEDLGRQMLTYGKREDPVSLCARIDKVTPEQVHQAAKAALASPVTLVAFGDVSHVPSYEMVASRFR